MLKDLKISTKLFLSFLVICVAFIITAAFFLQASHLTLKQATFDHLESVREGKKKQLETLFNERKNDLEVLSNIVFTFNQAISQRLQAVHAVKKHGLESYFREHRNDVEVMAKRLAIPQILQRCDHNLSNAPSTLSENKSLTESPSESAIRKQPVITKELVAPELEKFKRDYGYHDLFLVTHDGNLILSLGNEFDAGKNLLDVTLKDHPLSQVFQKVQAKKVTIIQDFAPYQSANNQYLAFIATPIILENQLLGVLVLSLLPDEINAIVATSRDGMVKSQQSYIIGELNGKSSYRSNRIVKGKEVYGIGREENEAEITRALSGESGTVTRFDSNEQVEMSRYTPLNIPDLRWVLITTADMEEMLATIASEERGNFFENYIRVYGYSDLFIIHPKGKIFFTVKHEPDYNTNIINGLYANTELGKLVQQVLETKTFGRSDYDLYAPSNNEPAAFIAQPLIQQGEIKLIIALQLNHEALNEIMTQRAGMGKSGEAYLVGSDKLMRSNTLGSPNHTVKVSFANPGLGTVDTQASRAVLEHNETGSGVITDYRNIKVLSAYTPLHVGNTRWALIAEIDEAEVFGPLRKLEWVLGIVMVIVSIFIVLIGWWTIHSIKTPLAHLIEIAQSIATGNFNNTIKISGRNEINQLLIAFKTMQAQLYDRFKENQQITEQLQERFIQDKQVTEEINAVTQAASQGDFSKRINLNDKEGLFKVLAESINQVLDFNRSAIKDLMRVFSAVSQGDLTQTIAAEYVGELAQLKHDANATVDKLTEILKVIRHSSEVVSNAAEEISQGNADLSQRTTEQAASLQETAANMEQMTSTVQQSAENATHANQLALSAKERAEQGNRVVNAAVEAINEISKSSHKITEIISVIDEIAFQTNLLALNAAVEAARAGEHGRGFAVVALEVRVLAQRSSSAAKEIKVLIQDSSARVAEGTRLANQSGEALAEILIAVKKVSDIIAEIAAASAEQSRGIAQVNKAVVQMEEMIEKNSSLVEQAAAASESMKDQAKELKRQVTFFNIGDDIPTATAYTVKKIPFKKTATEYPKKKQEDDWKEF